jgi:hypothetical protein
MRTWNINKTQFKVGDFISWQKSKTLILSPSFQRRPVWKPSAKSYLVDTIIRGLPIPIIFLRERQTNLNQYEAQREVVDGQQRIRALISFISPSLLSDFRPERDEFTMLKTHNKELAGKAFPDLPNNIRQSILDYQFSVHVLPSEVDDREILQIFARMNSTGVKLNDQELRNAEYFGEFKTAAYEQAVRQLNRWRQWGIFTEDNIARMDEVELTSELFSMIINGIAGKSQRAISALYRAKDEKFAERAETEHRFGVILDSIDQYFGNELKHSVFHKKTLFYILFAAVYDLQFGIQSSLVRKTPHRLSSEEIREILDRGERLFSEKVSKGILDATTRRTTHPQERKILFGYLRGY